MIKVMIVDDLGIFRDTLKYMLDQDTDIKVVGVASNGFEAFEAGWSFKDLCQIEEQRLNIKTSQYTSFIAGTVDFSNPLTWDNCH